MSSRLRQTPYSMPNHRRPESTADRLHPSWSHVPAGIMTTDPASPPPQAAVGFCRGAQLRHNAAEHAVLTEDGVRPSPLRIRVSCNAPCPALLPCEHRGCGDTGARVDGKYDEPPTHVEQIKREEYLGKKWQWNQSQCTAVDFEDCAVDPIQGHEFAF